MVELGFKFRIFVSRFTFLVLRFVFYFDVVRGFGVVGIRSFFGRKD